MIKQAKHPLDRCARPYNPFIDCLEPHHVTPCLELSVTQLYQLESDAACFSIGTRFRKLFEFLIVINEG